MTVVGRSRVQFLHRETNVRGEKPIKIKSELAFVVIIIITETDVTFQEQ